MRWLLWQLLWVKHISKHWTTCLLFFNTQKCSFCGTASSSSCKHQPLALSGGHCLIVVIWECPCSGYGTPTPWSVCSCSCSSSWWSVGDLSWQSFCFSQGVVRNKQKDGLLFFRASACFSNRFNMLQELTVFNGVELFALRISKEMFLNRGSGTQWLCQNGASWLCACNWKRAKIPNSVFGIYVEILSFSKG